MDNDTKIEPYLGNLDELCYLLQQESYILTRPVISQQGELTDNRITLVLDKTIVDEILAELARREVTRRLCALHQLPEEKHTESDARLSELTAQSGLVDLDIMEEDLTHAITAFY